MLPAQVLLDHGMSTRASSRGYQDIQQESSSWPTVPAYGATVNAVIFNLGRLQGLLSGQGSTALRGQILTVVDVPVILQVEFQQSKLYVWMVAQIQFIDRVLELPLVQQRSVPTAQTMQKTVEIPQLLFFCRRRCEHAATSSSRSRVPQISSSTASMAVVGGCEGLVRRIYGFFRTPPHGVESRVSSDFFFEPSMANSSWSSRARGWRGRRESDSQVFCHM